MGNNFLLKNIDSIILTASTIWWDFKYGLIGITIKTKKETMSMKKSKSVLFASNKNNFECNVIFYMPSEPSHCIYRLVI